MNPEHKKSVLKTLSWRIIATGTTMFLAFIIFGQLELKFMAGIGIGDVAIKMIFYFLHEKIWDRQKLRPRALITRSLH